MRKSVSLLLIILPICLLAGCNKSSHDTKKETTAQTKQSTQKITSSSNNKSTNNTKSNESFNTTEPTIDDVRKINPDEEVSLLRRQLYEAGINSSDMSDSEIEGYAKKAKEKKLDFITYMEENVLQ